MMFVWKQMVAIMYSSVTFYLFIVYNDYDIIKIFKNYLSIAYIICIIGLFQELSYIIGFEYGYNFTHYFSYWTLYTTEFEYYIKVNSIISEPSHFAIALSPALFVSFDRLIDRRNTFLNIPRSFAIIITYFLTGSALAMLAFIVTIFLIAIKYSFLRLLFNKKYIPYSVSFALLLTFAGNFVYNLPFIKMRIDDSWTLITSNNQFKSSKDLNLSTFALFSNYTIAMESFQKNPLFGSGIGTHPATYDKYILKYFDKNLEGVKLQINKDDANSLFIRLLSELGLLGVFLFLGFLYKNFIRHSQIGQQDYSFWVINNSIVVFLLIRFIRFGNYSLLGFFLFTFIYYFSYKFYLNNKKNAVL